MIIKISFGDEIRRFEIQKLNKQNVLNRINLSFLINVEKSFSLTWFDGAGNFFLNIICLIKINSNILFFFFV
jgi:hypothetical protein